MPACRPSGRSSNPDRVKDFFFFLSFRPALGSTQPPIQCVLGAVSRTGAWSWPLSSIHCRGRGNMGLYTHSSIHLHGVVINWLSERATLLLYQFNKFTMQVSARSLSGIKMTHILQVYSWSLFAVETCCALQVEGTLNHAWLNKGTWRSEDKAPLFLNSTLNLTQRSAWRPGVFVPRDIAPGNHWTGDWVGPIADVMEKKSLAPTGIRTPVVQAVT
jgi:hypothetical protein